MALQANDANYLIVSYCQIGAYELGSTQYACRSAAETEDLSSVAYRACRNLVDMVFYFNVRQKIANNLASGSMLYLKGETSRQHCSITPDKHG